MRTSSALCFWLLLAVGCGSGGGAGKITGRVTVEGGQTSGVVVEALGPTPSAAAADEGGAFSIEGLRDGWYVVRATLPAAEVPTQEAVVHVERGAADKEPTLAFKLAKGMVSGKAVFSDMSAASGLPVSLAGPVSRSAVTDMMGAFSIENLPSGAYVLTVEAANTRERRQSVTFTLDSASAAVTLADLPFIAVGTVTGTVKDSTMMAISGAEVTVPGTSVRALTDVSGAFELVDVPAGMRSVIATRAGAVSLSAKADVTVVRGANPPLMLTLMASTPPTGTVRGGVTFFHSGPADLISVSALGSNVSTRVSLQGQYSLDVAAGEWDIVAEAPNYPRLLLGRVNVKEGTSQQLPPAHLTLYQRFPVEPGLFSASNGGVASEGDWLLLQTNTTRGNQWWVVNGKTLSRRLYHEAGMAGGSPAVSSVLSRTGQHLAYFAGSGLYLVNLSTGAQVAFTRTAGQHDFSTDETVYFGAEAGNLMRYTLASATRRDFPGSTVKLTRDRWLVVNASAREVTLVTPTAEHLVFSNTDIVAYSPLPYAYSGCVMGTGCTIRMLPGNATAAVTLQGTYSTAASFYNGPPMESSGEYAPFNTTALQRLVKVTDGTFVDLPANTTRVDFNETGTRLFYLSGMPGNTNLREEAVPATGTGTPLTTFTGPVSAQWISASRIVAFDDSGAGNARRIEVRNGTMTVDTNYVPGSGAFVQPMAHWARSSDMKRAAVVADASVRTLDITYPGTGVSVSGGYEGLGLPGRWGAISDNTLSSFKGTFVLDAPKDEVRLLTQYRVNAAIAGPPLTLPRTWLGSHAFSSESGVLLFSTDQFISLQEPGIAVQFSLQRPVGSWSVVLDNSAGTNRLALGDLPYP